MSGLFGAAPGLLTNTVGHRFTFGPSPLHTIIMASTWDKIPANLQKVFTDGWLLDSNTTLTLAEHQAKIASALSNFYGGPDEVYRALREVPGDPPIFDEGRDFPPDIPCSVFANGDLRIFFCEERSPIKGLISLWFGRTTDPNHEGDRRRDCIHWMPTDFDLKVQDPTGDWIEVHRPRRFLGGTRIRVTYDSGSGRKTQEVIIPYLPEPNVEVAMLVNNS